MMSRILAITLVLLVGSLNANPPERLYPVTQSRVIDGDTIETTLDLGFRVSFTASMRLDEIDAPEKSTDAGKAVKLVVEMKVKQIGDNLWVMPKGSDKYGGRFDGVAIDMRDGSTLNNYLLSNGLAKKFTGATAKKPWTADELSAIEAKAKAILSNQAEVDRP